MNFCPGKHPLPGPPPQAGEGIPGDEILSTCFLPGKREGDSV